MYCGGRTGFEGRRVLNGVLGDEVVDAGAVVDVRGVGRRWEASLRWELLRHMLPHCTLCCCSFVAFLVN